MESPAAQPGLDSEIVLLNFIPVPCGRVHQLLRLSRRRHGRGRRRDRGRRRRPSPSLAQVPENRR